MNKLLGYIQTQAGGGTMKRKLFLYMLLLLFFILLVLASLRSIRTFLRCWILIRRWNLWKTSCLTQFASI